MRARIALVGAAVLILAVGVIAWTGYNRLTVVSTDVTGITPALDTDALSLARASIKVVTGDILGAASEVVEGVEIDIELTVENDFFTPLYLAPGSHVVSLNGVEITNQFQSGSGWMEPYSTKALLLSAVVPFEQLPEAVIAVLVQGGEINVDVESTIGWSFFTVDHTSEVYTYSVLDTLESIIRRLL
jgi:LEA14-like dessication related protein